MSSPVLCWPPWNTVVAEIVIPRPARASRTCGSFRNAAISRPFGPPAFPEHAPQRYADRCGLFAPSDPCPNSSTSCENPRVRPMNRSTRSAMVARSSGLNLRWSPAGPHTGAAGWAVSRVPSGGLTRLAATRSIFAHACGNSTRATSGTDANTPTPALDSAPAPSPRLPAVNRLVVSPSHRRHRAVRRAGWVHLALYAALLRPTAGPRRGPTLTAAELTFATREKALAPCRRRASATAAPRRGCGGPDEPCCVTNPNSPHGRIRRASVSRLLAPPSSQPW
ncbi:hypothetical protein J0H58_20820 [bacterium]|nr:hypothetical protein [bacterium]